MRAIHRGRRRPEDCHPARGHSEDCLEGRCSPGLEKQQGCGGEERSSEEPAPHPLRECEAGRGAEDLPPNLALSLPSCVTLVTSLNLSEPQFLPGGVDRVVVAVAVSRIVKSRLWSQSPQIPLRSEKWDNQRSSQASTPFPAL